MTVLTPVIDQALCPKLMVASQEGDQHAYCQLLMKVVPLVEAIAVHQGFNAASTDTLIADVLRTEAISKSSSQQLWMYNKNRKCF